MSEPNQNEIPTPSDDRDGNWLDKWGCCKVCDGEIPYGHQENCDIYKLEKEAHLYKSQLTELRGLAKELDNQLESFDYGESDNDGSAIRKARYAFQQFLAHQNL